MGTTAKGSPGAARRRGPPHKRVARHAAVVDTRPELRSDASIEVRLDQRAAAIAHARAHAPAPRRVAPPEPVRRARRRAHRASAAAAAESVL